MPIQSNEILRLRALRDLNLLDTQASESFDRITRMASQLFSVPISAVSLTDEDRQWFKSRVGCGTEIPRFQAPCAEVTRTNDLLVVRDLSCDTRFDDSVLVRNGVKFYAGAPLTTREGFTLGAMCVLDTEPRDISAAEAQVLRDLASMVMSQIELQHALGRLDPSSGLPNRNQFAEDVADLARDYVGEARVAAVIDLADPSQLAQAMRVMGPAYLDDLIKTSTEFIRQVVPTNVPLYHVGATQFAAILPAQGMTELRQALGALVKDLATGRHDEFPHVSALAIGLAPFKLANVDPADVLRSAHAAAQDARDAAVGVSTYSDALDAAHQRRYALTSGLREALTSKNELALVYQPRVDVKTGRCHSAEALLRWKHPTLGNISPAEFIPVAEQSHLARPVTEWVINAAMEQVKVWNAQGLTLRVSLNVSALNLEEFDFAIRLAASLHFHGLPPKAIEIEFTESAFIKSPEVVLRNLRNVKKAGICCAIDDFGTGYSSFSYLRDLPADVIKIDQSFIRTLRAGDRDCAIVRNMITMAHELGYSVVAEGVETQEAYDFLASVGCDEAQGYWLSKPISPQDIVEWCVARAHHDSSQRGAA